MPAFSECMPWRATLRCATLRLTTPQAKGQGGSGAPACHAPQEGDEGEDCGAEEQRAQRGPQRKLEAAQRGALGGGPRGREVPARGGGRGEQSCLEGGGEGVGWAGDMERKAGSAHVLLQQVITPRRTHHCATVPLVTNTRIWLASSSVQTKVNDSGSTR